MGGAALGTFASFAAVLKLREPTDPRWVSRPCSADMDAFLVDHAACERKASATAMNFVVRYPRSHARFSTR